MKEDGEESQVEKEKILYLLSLEVQEWILYPLSLEVQEPSKERDTGCKQAKWPGMAQGARNQLKWVNDNFGGAFIAISQGVPKKHTCF